METRQFFTNCRNCGRQILMTYDGKDRRWIPCDPEIRKYKASGGPETYVTPTGELKRGVRDYNGEFGYRKHRKDCKRS